MAGLMDFVYKAGHASSDKWICRCSRRCYGRSHLAQRREQTSATLDSICFTQALCSGRHCQAYAEASKSLVCQIKAAAEAVITWRALEECGRVLGAAKRQADAMRGAADHLAYLHAELQGSAAPIYDVPTAFEVQQTGAFPTPDAIPCSVLLALEQFHMRNR